jgi:hypothetical protein
MEEADDNMKGEQLGDKRWHHDETEQISSGNRYSGSSEHVHDTSDDDDEDPRPAKRRKLPVSTEGIPTPHREHTPPRWPSPPHCFMPLSKEQVEVDDAESQADHGFLPHPISDDLHRNLRDSQSPSAT